MYTVAAIQIVSAPELQANFEEVSRLVATAAEAGVQLVVLPENFACMGMDENVSLSIAEREGSGPIQDFLSKLASKHRVWVIGGTIPLQTLHGDKVRAACLVYDDKGICQARYDKIHLFDVIVEDNTRNYSESKRVEPGMKPVVVDTPFARLGLAVCYDMRFPELFRKLVEQGAELFAIPAAFTAVTGKAHWEILLRTRAVENLCYVVASAQGGTHKNGRQTYSHSMIINPWGEIMSALPEGSGVVISKIDPQKQLILRRDFPVLSHRKF